MSINRLSNSNRFCVDKFQNNISLQLVASAQFSSEQLVLSTFWQTGVVFRVTLATDTVV